MLLCVCPCDKAFQGEIGVFWGCLGVLCPANLQINRLQQVSYQKNIKALKIKSYHRKQVLKGCGARLCSDVGLVGAVMITACAPALDGICQWPGEGLPLSSYAVCVLSPGTDTSPSTAPGSCPWRKPVMGETGKEEYKIQSFDAETQKLLKTALKGQQALYLLLCCSLAGT